MHRATDLFAASPRGLLRYPLLFSCASLISSGAGAPFYAWATAGQLIAIIWLFKPVGWWQHAEHFVTRMNSERRACTQRLDRRGVRSTNCFYYGPRTAAPKLIEGGCRGAANTTLRRNLIDAPSLCLALHKHKAGVELGSALGCVHRARISLWSIIQSLSILFHGDVYREAACPREIHEANNPQVSPSKPTSNSFHQ